jgi:hypothetical protein
MVTNELGVMEHPPINLMINKITVTPPRAEIAEVVFYFISKYQSEISGEQWKSLKHANIIPFEKVGCI